MNQQAEQPNAPQYLPQDDGEFIAYLPLNSKLNSTMSVVFLSGFMSDMNGSKAAYLAEFCKRKELHYVRFDYYGHGVSSGEFQKGSIGRWLRDTLAVIDALACPSTLLVGSSMGGWLMLLAALARPEKVKGLIGIAAAPDFTETLIWEILPPHQQAELLDTGMITLPAEYCSGSYPITRHLIEEARQHLLLDKKIPIECPVTLLHGMKDDDVPFQTSVQLAGQLATEQVKVTLLKDGDHRMSEPPHLEELSRALEEMLAQLTQRASLT
jgi:pimeloyl-ACP methyl ester carboxylesterase